MIMKSFGQLVLFALLFVTDTKVVVAQDEDCPNEVSDCSGACEEAQCARFLTAECRENPCFGLCSPNFFWRGTDVTDRCDVERCSDRECPGSRICVEDIAPASCPVGNPSCRQHIRVRCVLPPPPKNCSQITCDGPGMFCRKGFRGKGVRCVRARRCSQLKCKEGFTCTETDEGPLCTRLPPPSSCEEAACSEETVCSLLSVSERDISIARCISRDEADRMPVYSPEFSCSTFNCNENEACMDVFEDGRFLTSVCNVVACDTSDPSTCPSNRVCVDVPASVQIPYTTSCSPSPPGFQFGGGCTTLNPCPPGLACHDIFIDGVTIGVGCGISAETYSGFTCDDLGCPAPLECFETVVEGRGSLAMCESEESVTVILDGI